MEDQDQEFISVLEDLIEVLVAPAITLATPRLASSQANARSISSLPCFAANAVSFSTIAQLASVAYMLPRPCRRPKRVSWPPASPRLYLPVRKPEASGK